MNKFINFIIWPAISGLVFGLVLYQLPRLAEHIPGLNPYLPGDNIQHVTLNSFSYADAISKAAPAVVSINSRADVRRVNQQIYNPFTRRFLLQNDESTSLGSGVIISPDGYIITSFHIFEVQNPDIVQSSMPEINVTLYNGQVIEARPVAFDDRNDLALLKVDAADLAYLTPSEESSLDAGDVVLAIGNPRNIGQSVTSGIISALLQTGDSYVIQTDAAINPGSSGGALIDVDGRLVGINSTIVTESGGFEGISFAVPARKAYDLMDAYIDQGPGGYLGVDGRFIGRVASSMLVGAEVRGFWVQSMLKNGPAEKAGIKVDDIIQAFDDIKINSDENVIYAMQTVGGMGPGETVIAHVYRDGEVLEIPIVLSVGEGFLYSSYEEEPLFDPNPFSEGLLR